MDTAALVARVRQGDPEAFRELFSRVESSAFALALAQMGNAEDAREVVQEAALESYRSIRSLRDPARFPAWVCGMVRFLALRRLRRPRTLSLDVLPVEPASLPVPEDGGSDVLVRRALLSIPSRYREVLVLRHMEGKGYEEIAGLLGLSVAGVDSRLARGRAMLRRRLKTLERGWRAAP